MKILHVIPGVAARYGGPSEAIFSMCRALQEQGIELLIATTDADGANSLPVELGKNLPWKGIPTIFFACQISERFKYSRPLGQWLDAMVAKFDVVHIHAIFSYSSITAASACRKHGIPYVVRPLGSLAPWALKQNWFRKRFLWHLGIKQMLSGAAAIHYTAVAERQMAQDNLGLERGVIIPHGVDEQLLNSTVVPGLSEQRLRSIGQHPYVLVLSRLHTVKGLELLLEIFLELIRQDEFRHWRLVIAGDGEAKYVESLKRLVSESDGTGYVLFTGWLDGPEKIAVLREAALLALPSHQENFGLSVAEAMACKVPVLVSTHVNLAKEVRGAGAGWIVSLERDNLAKTLTEALRNEEERTKRGWAGRNLVRSRFTWPTIAKDLIGLYRIVMERAPLRCLDFDRSQKLDLAWARDLNKT